MKISKHILASVLGAASLSLTAVSLTAVVGADMMLTTTAEAQSRDAKQIVDKAKANGQIGETTSGYLAVVDSSASTDVVNAMNEINIGRRSVYTRLAREQNVSIDVVAALTGEKQVASAAPGEKVMNSSGRWVTVK